MDNVEDKGRKQSRSLSFFAVERDDTRRQDTTMLRLHFAGVLMVLGLAQTALGVSLPSLWSTTPPLPEGPRSDKQNLVISRKPWKGTAKEFFDNRFEMVDGQRVPKIDKDLGSFGYLMRAFNAIIGPSADLEEGDKIKCHAARDCGYIEKMGLELFKKIGTFKSSIPLQVGQIGVMVVVKEHKMTLLSLKGAASPLNWLHSALAVKTPTDEAGFGIEGAYVHSGFRWAASQVYPAVKAAFEEADRQHPTHEMVIAGLSMGAATSQILALWLLADPEFKVRDKAARLRLFPIASPRVGDRAFAEGLMGKLPDTVRYTSADDPIPGLPPYSGPEGYAHTPLEVWTSEAADRSKDKEDDVIVLPTYVCTGYWNNQCNNQFTLKQGFGNYVLNHLSYFGIRIPDMKSEKADQSV